VERDDDEQERLNRQLIELLNELRVALPGVQVLFAFLLVVPFQQGFRSVTNFDHYLYLGTLLCAALASAFLIAPTAHHRLMFRRQDKEHLVQVSNRQTVVGLTFLAVAMTGAIALATDVLFKPATTALAAGVVALAFSVLWYLLPLLRRSRVE
jgi:uncharacterized membrane protein YbhN (UPF0104 family)